ncbi:hypothetical protein [Jiulongibacter sediminis]|jgi:hypothetical protein|uniref:hypothetical protein n=1 Tax=Jiulongibacter sediminis TaxID=1605367 RepID=UPI0026ECB404|nr:hypothetical protein [Jiulongibacter sediminis]
MIKSILNIPVQIINSVAGFFQKLAQATKRPMRSGVLTLKSLISAVVVALSVFVLFYFAQPFGIRENTALNKNLLISIASVAGFLGILISDYLLPITFKKFFDSSQWTVIRQFSLFVLRFFFVGLLVMVFSNQVGLAKFDLPMVLLEFTGFGAVNGFIISFLQESTLRSKFSSKSEIINRNLQNFTPVESQKMLFPVMAFSGANEKLSLVPNQLVSVSISKYKSQLLYQNFFGLADKELDIQAEDVKKELQKHPQFIQISDHEYANAHALYKVTGDASGYELHIAKRAKPVRLSRKFEKTIESL